jgi:hypothetical protein
MEAQAKARQRARWQALLPAIRPADEPSRCAVGPARFPAAAACEHFLYEIKGGSLRSPAPTSDDPRIGLARAAGEA